MNNNDIERAVTPPPTWTGYETVNHKEVDIEMNSLNSQPHVASQPSQSQEQLVVISNSEDEPDRRKLKKIFDLGCSLLFNTTVFICGILFLNFVNLHANVTAISCGRRVCNIHLMFDYKNQTLSHVVHGVSKKYITFHNITSQMDVSYNYCYDTVSSDMFVFVFAGVMMIWMSMAYYGLLYRMQFHKMTM